MQIFKRRGDPVHMGVYPIAEECGVEVDEVDALDGQAPEQPKIVVIVQHTH